MNKLLTAAALVASLGAALPAAAQSYGGGFGGYDRGIGRDFDGGGFRGDRGIERRIERGLRSGTLSERDAWGLRRQLDDIRRLEWQFSRDGVSPREARTLDQRYASLEHRLRVESGDRGYGQGYSRGGYGFR